MSLYPRFTYRLDWDPSNTKTAEGETSRFEWVIDHEYQKWPDWCWAACLRNALTSIGRYWTKEEIRDSFFQHKGWPLEPKAADRKTDERDERIPTPEDIPDLWSLFGYAQAEPQWWDEPPCFNALAKEIADHGPVQIELQREAGKPSHLALIYGIFEKDGRPHVCVSNPASMGIDTFPYDDLKDNPLGGDFGKWRRTYLNQGNREELRYLRRFFGSPTKYLARLDIKEDIEVNLTSKPEVERKDSSLRFETLDDKKPRRLKAELSLASYGYRHYRYRDAPEEDRERREAELRQRLFLLESIRVWRPSDVIDYKRDLREQLQPGRWHHQIFNRKEPRYYAHTYFSKDLQKRFGSGWRTVWMGERWAQPVHDALRALEKKYKDREEEVRLVWLEQEGLVTLQLAESNLHLVAISPDQKILPSLGEEPFTDEQLRTKLAELPPAPPSHRGPRTSSWRMQRSDAPGGGS